MFWHRGCPVAAVMGADAAVHFKVDLIRGRSPEKYTISNMPCCDWEVGMA